MSHLLIRGRLQKALNDDNIDITFTDNELQQLFNSPITPSLILSILLGLKNKILSADQVIRSVIQTGPTNFNEKTLLILGLSLRYQGSLNQYIDISASSNSLSKLHLIVWTCQNFPQKDFKTLYCILKSSNINYDSPVTQPIKDNKETISKWIHRHCPDNIFFDQNISLCNYPIAILTDQPTKLMNSFSVLDLEQVITDAITSYSSNVLDNLKHNLNDIIVNDKSAKFKSLVSAELVQPSSKFHNSYFLELSIKCLNSYAYNLLLDLGWIPTYSVINNILIFMKYYHQRKNNIANKYLLEILTTTLSKGYYIDNVQHISITSIYPTDVIQKINFPKPSSNTLKNLATLLEIEIETPKDIRNHYSKIPINKVLSTILSYERRSIETTTIYTDMIPIKNSISYSEGDIDLFCIVDKSLTKWPIFPYSLEIIRSTRNNPITGEILENKRFYQVIKQRNTIKRLGFHTEMNLNGNDIYNVYNNNGIKSLKVYTDDDFSGKIIDTFKMLSPLYGLDSRDIFEHSYLTVKYIEKILTELANHFPMIPTELHHLKDDHIIVTFIRICILIIRQCPSIADNIFTMIKLAISKKRLPA